MTETVLEVNDLHVSFYIAAGEVQAVRGVDFHLNKGETLAIVGESGSGKSVTTKAITKLFQKDTGRIKKGEILFLGEDLAQKSEKELIQLRGRDISMIFQDPMTSLNPTMQIGKQVMEPLIKHKKLSKAKAKQRALEILNLVGLPRAEKRFKAYPHQFSGGQRQRIVIAIALACEPKILIADEPTTALDVTMQAQILDLMKELQNKIETSIIFITHDLGVVANIADKVAVMYGGQMVETGDVNEIFYDPKHPYTWGLLSSMPDLTTSNDTDLIAIPGTPPDLLHPPIGDAFARRSRYALDIDFKEEPPWFKISPTHFVKSWLLDARAPKVTPPSMVQKRLRTMPSNYEQPHRVISNENVLLQVKNLKQYFNQGKHNEVKAIDNISFDVYKGETLGLVGESGCGKSTTGKAIIKLNDITDGAIEYDGKDIHQIRKRKERLKFNKKIQMIFQDPYASLNPRLKVMDIVAEGIDIHKLASSQRDRKKRVYDLLETVGLGKEHANRYPHEFSGGQRQRIGIARALAVEPEFIIADEPISALDVSIQAQVVNLLLKLQRERDITLLFIAHDLSMVKYISDRIAVMHFGKIVEIGPADDIYNYPLHDYTKSLLSAIPQPDPDVERNRQRVLYHEDATLNEERQLNEIRPQHYVFSTQNEAVKLKQKYGLSVK